MSDKRVFEVHYRTEYGANAKTYVRRFESWDAMMEVVNRQRSLAVKDAKRNARKAKRSRRWVWFIQRSI